MFPRWTPVAISEQAYELLLHGRFAAKQRSSSSATKRISALSRRADERADGRTDERIEKRDDKRADENDLNFLCFDVGSDATVYVLYDSRASTLPGWVAADYVDKHQAAAIHTDTNMAQGVLASRLRSAAFNGKPLTSASPPQVSRSTGTRWRRATSAWAATARRVRARTTLSWSARRASRRPGAKPFGVHGR